jgi:non-canonical (house-cleaning) NTP pyrophosphatase
VFTERVCNETKGPYRAVRDGVWAAWQADKEDFINTICGSVDKILDDVDVTYAAIRRSNTEALSGDMVQFRKDLLEEVKQGREKHSKGEELLKMSGLDVSERWV